MPLSLTLHQRGDWLTRGETALELVPVRDGFLAEFPAEVNIMSLMSANEIDEPRRGILQLATDGAQFIDQTLETLHRCVQIALGGLHLLAGHCGEIGLKIRRVFVRMNDILNDPFHERQRFVGLRDREPPGRFGGMDGLRGGKLRTWHIRLSARRGKIPTTRQT